MMTSVNSQFKIHIVPVPVRPAWPALMPMHYINSIYAFIPSHSCENVVQICAYHPKLTNGIDRGYLSVWLCDRGYQNVQLSPTAALFTHLCQFRRVLGHCSQHKCGCLLVEPLWCGFGWGRDVGGNGYLVWYMQTVLCAQLNAHITRSQAIPTSSFWSLAVINYRWIL